MPASRWEGSWRLVGHPTEDFRWQEVPVDKPHCASRCRHQDLDVSACIQIPLFRGLEVHPKASCGQQSFKGSGERGENSQTGEFLATGTRGCFSTLCILFSGTSSGTRSLLNSHELPWAAARFSSGHRPESPRAQVLLGSDKIKPFAAGTFRRGIPEDQCQEFRPSWFCRGHVVKSNGLGVQTLKLFI